MGRSGNRGQGGAGRPRVPRGRPGPGPEDPWGAGTGEIPGYEFGTGEFPAARDTGGFPDAFDTGEFRAPGTGGLPRADTGGLRAAGNTGGFPRTGDFPRPGGTGG